MNTFTHNQFFPSKTLFLAPMEGITDERYRLAIHNLYPQWDYYFTDFLRIPSSGHYTNQHIINFFGQESYQNSTLKNKTIFQVLTSENANNEYTIKQIDQLGFKWLDLNLGCPSKTVNKHGGGAYLLEDLDALRRIIKTLRLNFKGHLTAKMRIGYRDDTKFEEGLKVLEGEGIEAITLHARTRDQLYKGYADWSYIQKAVELTSIPIVGNGDIWTLKDIEDIYKKTNCHSIMMARGQLKTPWMAKLWKEQTDNGHISIKEELHYRLINIPLYFNSFETSMKTAVTEEAVILKKFKAVSRYIFDDFYNGELCKRTFLRSKTLDEFKTNLGQLNKWAYNL